MCGYLAEPRKLREVELRQSSDCRKKKCRVSDTPEAPRGLPAADEQSQGSGGPRSVRCLPRASGEGNEHQSNDHQEVKPDSHQHLVVEDPRQGLPRGQRSCSKRGERKDEGGSEADGGAGQSTFACLQPLGQSQRSEWIVCHCCSFGDGRPQSKDWASRGLVQSGSGIRGLKLPV